MPKAPRAVVLVGACGYSLVAAATTPFTWEADLITAIPILGMAVLLVWRWPLRTTSTRHAGAQSGHRFLPWLILFVAVAAWETCNYLVHGSRAEHPTFSSMTDAVDRFYLLKVMVFLAWLAFAWLILDGGSRGEEAEIT